MKKIKKTVLSYQKPTLSKRKKIKYKRYIIFSAVAGLVVAGVYFGFAGYRSFVESNQTGSSLPLVNNWRINVVSSEESKVREAVSKQAKKILLSNPADGLTALGRGLQKEFEAEQVHVFKTAEDEIAIKISLRKPIMRIKADRMRLITESGKVYGTLQNFSDSTNESMPLLSGIFSERNEPFAMSEDHSLLLTKGEQVLIKEAIALLESSKQFSHPIKGIEYVKFRGFVITTKNDDVEISIGRAPFKEQFRQLSSILKNLKKNGSQALRIELDYKGKDFIKEKEL